MASNTNHKSMTTEYFEKSKSVQELNMLGAWINGWNNMAQKHLLTFTQHVFRKCDCKTQGRGITIKINKDKLLFISVRLSAASSTISSHENGTTTYFTYLLDNKLQIIFDTKIGYPDPKNPLYHEQEYEHEYYDLDYLSKEIDRVIHIYE
jgi:hypothetical protein